MGFDLHVVSPSPPPNPPARLQVCVALQVPGQQPVAAGGPAGGDGGVGPAHTGSLRRRRVGHQVQRPVPHRREAQLDLLQGPDRQQQGEWGRRIRLLSVWLLVVLMTMFAR